MKQEKRLPADLLDTQSLVITDVWVEAERLRLLKRVLPWIGLLLAGSTIGTFASVIWKSNVWQLWSLVAFMPVSLGAYALAVSWCRKGRSVQSSYLIIITVSVFALAIAILFEDLIVVFAILGLLLTLLASVLISLQMGYSVAIGLIIIGLGLVFLDSFNILPPTWDLKSQVKQWIDMVAFITTLFLGTYLVALNQEGTRLALNRLVERSNELKTVNKQLAREIKERERIEATLAELNTSLEAQVTARTAEIIAEKEKSETILHNVGDAIGMAGLDMKLTYINEAFTTITGYSAETIIGKPVHVLIDEQLPQQELQELKTTLANGESWQREVVARRKDGRMYDAMMTIVPVRDAAGHHVGYAASHQDISHVKNMERARNRFITNISHELRTPVATLKLYAHMLKQEISPERREKYRDVLEEQISQLEALIEDIIEITALDSGKAVTAWELIPFGRLIEGCMASHQSRAAVKGIALRLNPLPHAIPTVKGDQHRLSQALHEIIENAVIFTPAGGEITLALEIQENHERTWVVLSVHDTGPGIAPDEQGAVFERFYRGKLAESGHIPGTGLGLSIVHEIMRAHGGQVTVESQEEHGSTFRLWLPAIPDS